MQYGHEEEGAQRAERERGASQVSFKAADTARTVRRHQERSVFLRVSLSPKRSVSFCIDIAQHATVLRSSFVVIPQYSVLLSSFHHSACQGAYFLFIMNRSARMVLDGSCHAVQLPSPSVGLRDKMRFISVILCHSCFLDEKTR